MIGGKNSITTLNLAPENYPTHLELSATIAIDV